MSDTAKLVELARRVGVRLSIECDTGPAHWLERGTLAIIAPAIVHEVVEQLGMELLDHEAEVIAILVAEHDAWIDAPNLRGVRIKGPKRAPHGWRRPLELHTWPDADREAWGRRTNELEAAGWPWYGAEAQAYKEIAASRDDDGTESTLVGRNAG